MDYINFNSASRVGQILSDARKKVGSGTTINTVSAWAQCFDIVMVNQHDHAASFKIAQWLGLLHSEVLSAYEYIRGTGNFPESLYTRQLRDINIVLSPIRLNEPWKKTCEILNPSLIETFQTWSGICPDETQYDTNEISECITLIGNAMESLSESELPLMLRTFMYRNAEFLLDALLKYQVLGRRSILIGYTSVAGSLATASDDVRNALKENIEDEHVANVLTVFLRFNKWLSSDDTWLDKLGRKISNLDALWKASSFTANLLQSLSGDPPNSDK